MTASLGKISERTGFRVSFPCRLIRVRNVVSSMCSFLEHQGASEQEVSACELALVEGCNNAILYAAEGGRRKEVVAEALCDHERIELRVEDHTAGFDWPASVCLPDLKDETGRGLYLICSLMDTAQYYRGQGSNCLVMTKERTAEASSASLPVEIGVEELRWRLKEDERVIRDMADELSSCYESLSAIFRYGAEQGKQVVIRDFSRRLLGDLLRITGADWYAFRLLSQDQQALEIYTFSEPGSLPDAVLGRPEALEVQATQSRRDVWFEPDRAWEVSDPLVAIAKNAMGLIHPVYFGESLIGSLVVGKRSRDFTFTAARVNVIHTFAEFLAIQIVNNRLQEERVSSLLVQHELEIARHIQQSLLVKELPRLADLAVAAHCESARQVGGDFYDVIQISETSALIVVSDVMGKGIPAAMFAVILRTLVRALKALAPRPAALLTQLNRLLFDELSEVEMFITAQVAYVDLARESLVVGNAGHCPLFFTGAKDDGPRSISPEGVPLGVLEDPGFEEETLDLHGAAQLMVYSDGLTDVVDESGDQYGSERLRDWWAKASRERLGAAAMKRRLNQELEQFRGGQALVDDQTFVIVTKQHEVWGAL